MSLNVSKRVIRLASMIVSLAIASQVVLAQSTPPPRPTPTQADDSTPARDTPTPADTPVSSETPVRSTPYGTPMRPTPTTSNQPPVRATQTRQAGGQERNPTDATLAATPNLLPLTGGENREDGYGLSG